MSRNIDRRTFVAAAAGAASLAVLSGCSSSGSSSSASGASASASSASASAASSNEPVPTIKVGTLVVEDILPLWVAQEQGWLKALDSSVDIVEFQSATELIAGVGSGEIDMAMTDIMVAASLFASGTGVQLEWVTLSASPDKGHFGIMVGPDSDIQDLRELADKPIGVGSNTLLEYMMDKLMEKAGVPADQVKVEEIQKIPVRYQAMLSGEVAAAVLPGTLLALGEANGCRVIADDSVDESLTQSVMIARTAFLEQPGAAEAVQKLREVWNESVTDINEDPAAAHEVLETKADLPEQIAETYPLSDYPVCEIPSNTAVDPVLDWMEQKGYLSKPLAYDGDTGKFEAL